MDQAALGSGSPTIRLVIVPVLISLVVTLWRLTGELLTWSTFIWLLAALTACLQYLGWPQFFKTVLAYGLGAQLPVVLIMALAMHGSWGTHYDAIPPGFPEMGWWASFMWLGFFPQLVFWVGFTIVTGAFFGIPAASLVHRRRTAVETAP